MKDMKDQVLIKLAHELAAQGYIQPEHFKNALKWQKTSGGDFYDYLVEKEYIKEETLAKVLAKKKNLPYVLVEEMEIDLNVVKVIPEKVIKKYFAIPIAKKWQRAYCCHRQSL